jgi:Raf kinase inhibitor-like YbhB/YbcL family protein
MKGRLSHGTGFARTLGALRALGVLPALGVLALALALGGCGGGSGSSGTSAAGAAAVPSSPATSAQGSSSSAGAVASVASTPISKSSYEHWLAVEQAGGTTSNASHRALSFLITSQWVIGEAAARKLSVSDTEVKQHLAQIEKQSFPKAGAFQKFLAKADETEADLLARVKVELLESRIAAKVTAGKRGAQAKSVLASFQKAFQEHWKRFTTCKSGYVMEDCSEYKGKGEDLAATRSSSGSSAGSSRSSSSGSSGSSKSSSSKSSVSSSSSASSSSSSSSSTASNGEIPTHPGELDITSSAFEDNGALPKQYTCDGANISPPLEWQNVPAKAAALVLIMIDDSSTGPASGIRWFVGDINPSSKGTAAGQTPEGGIVGSDTQGKSGYGGICPPAGKTSTIQFTLYALSKKIPLTPGFQPSLAESEYGAGKLLMGEAGTTYATYTRG